MLLKAAIGTFRVAMQRLSLHSQRDKITGSKYHGSLSTLLGDESYGPLESSVFTVTQLFSK